MKNSLLMQFEEPSDKQLFDLMHEVAIEAKARAILAKKQLAKKIKKEIENAQIKFVS